MVAAADVDGGAPVVAPYGSWPSPVTAATLTRSAAGLGGPVLDAGDVWWSELRPEEGGRVQLVRKQRNGPPTDVLPDGVSARTRVHEYGGGAWVVNDRVAYIARWDDQRLYRVEPGTDPVALTPEPPTPGAHRYADLRLRPGRQWLVCVRERHEGDGDVVNELVAVRTRPGDEPADPVVLWSGPDFVSNPRISVDGSTLCWLQWDHPRMPWDGTELWAAELVPGDAPTLARPQRVLGGPDESVAQPEWSPAGVLHAVSDADGWWNLWAFPRAGAPTAGTAEQVTHVQGELAQPQWVFGQSWYCFTTGGDVVGCWRFDGTDHLGVVPAGGDGSVRWLDLPFTSFDGLASGDGDTVAFLAASFTGETQVVTLDDPAGTAGETGPTLEIVRPARDLGIDPSWWSVPEPVDFPTTGGRTAHALYYPPHHPERVGPDDERPPLLVLIHGGPTSAARPLLDLKVQLWTTRGWGVVDVNYGGSTGYGRAFRRQLDGQWGVVDVDDCEAAARALVERGAVDPERLAIKGGSAGGFTTLAALAFRDTFTAGSSLYGVADLEALARDTHKFESRYLDTLIGPYPERRDRYVERSPIHHLDGFDRPLVVFQGLEDEIVPPNQSEAIVAAVRAKGVPVAYLAFEGEQHGFRRAETIERVVTAEMYVLSRLFGIEPADELEPVDIDNL